MTEPLATSLPDGWTLRVPALGDLPRLTDLRRADQAPYTGSDQVDVEALAAEVAGQKSWTRRQVVAVHDGAVRAWATAHDRAAGRVLVHVYVDRSTPERSEVAAGLYAWLDQQGCDITDQRGLTESHLDASPFADDAEQRGWLAAAGYRQVRTWLHMTRPVTPADIEALPGPREGVVVRTVDCHEHGLPVAADLRLVHQQLEESFQDHFNSYRESFAEFVQRLREEPGHRWDHWWLAYVDGEPAGALVASLLPPGASGKEGSYVEYIGVNRRARGRGVAKALLFAVIRDVAARGGDRVSLEVDADSPTNADQLYSSLGWVTDYVTESWHRDVTV